MKKGKIMILTLLAFLVGQAETAFPDKWENWNDTNCAIRLTKKTSFDIYNRTKFGEAPFGETYLTGIQPGLNRRLSEKFGVLLAYRYEINNKKKYYEFENRFLLQFACRILLKDRIVMQLVQRSESRYFTRQTADNLRLRIRVDFSRKLTMRKFVIGPYLAGELFYDTNAHEINRQRIYLGTICYISPKYAIRLGWIGQIDKGKDFLDILNTGVNFAL